MSIGGENLLKEYNNSRLAVAEALILGKIKGSDLEYAGQLVSKVILEAARIRLKALGLLNKENILPALSES